MCNLYFCLVIERPKGLLKRHDQYNRITETVDGIYDIFEEYDMAEAAYANWFDEYEKKGLKEGRKEGEANLLVKLLTHRFGPLPKWAETRVNKAKSAQLEKCATAVLDASNLTEVLGAPGRQ